MTLFRQKHVALPRRAQHRCTLWMSQRPAASAWPTCQALSDSRPSFLLILPTSHQRPCCRSHSTSVLAEAE